MILPIFSCLADFYLACMGSFTHEPGQLPPGMCVQRKQLLGAAVYTKVISDAEDYMVNNYFSNCEADRFTTPICAH